MKRRLIVLVIAAVLCLSLLPTAFADENIQNTAIEDPSIALNVGLDNLSTEQTTLSIEEQSATAMKNRNAYTVQGDSIRFSSKLTANNPVDFYIVDIKAMRVFLYAVASSNPNLRISFCKYDPSTGNVFPYNGIYADVGKFGQLNAVDADKYVLMVTYKSGYTSDAAYTLLVNGRTTWKEGMRFQYLSNTLSYLQCNYGHYSKDDNTYRDVYINESYVATTNMKMQPSVNIACTSYSGVNWAYHQSVAGVVAANVSQPYYYTSENWYCPNAVFITIGPGTTYYFMSSFYAPGSSATETDSHDPVTGQMSPIVLDSTGGYIVYDYINGQVLDLVMSRGPAPEIPYAAEPIP